MKRTLVMAMIWVITLYSCAPSQDTSPEAAEPELRQRETLFHAAYAAFDQAVLARMLAEGYSLRQLDQASERSKAEWLSELQSLRAVFPRLQITVGEIDVTVDDRQATVKGQRTFSWTQGVETGSYREEYENHWIYEEGEWMLRQSQVRALH